MAKYYVNTCWEGSYGVTVEAENEYEAREKALDKIASLDDKEFYSSLDVQLSDTEIHELTEEDFIF